MNENITRVAVIMGSKSDLETVQETINVLQKLGVPHEVNVLSAHRTPKDVVKHVEELPGRGIQVVIAAAGMAAALAGTIAAHTILPVIGVPIETKTLKGLDSLLSTVQMPRGIPVACMSIGRSGAENAAIFACQILSLQDASLKKKMLKLKKDMANSVRKIKID